MNKQEIERYADLIIQGGGSTYRAEKGGLSSPQDREPIISPGN